MASRTRSMSPRTARVAVLSLIVTLAGGQAWADDPSGFLETVHKHVTLTSTVPNNGD
jgi:hypothetical protein